MGGEGGRSQQATSRLFWRELLTRSHHRTESPGHRHCPYVPGRCATTPSGWSYSPRHFPGTWSLGWVSSRIHLSIPIPDLPWPSCPPSTSSLPLHLAPTGSVHGKPRALGCSAIHSTLPHALAVGPFAVPINHINDCVIPKAECVPLPSARSEPVLLRFMVMPC